MPPGCRGGGARRALLCLLLALPAAAARAAAPGAAGDSAVKAAYLYKFGNFVEFPQGAFRGPGAPFVIGVWGDESIASELEQLARGRSIEGHPVKVLRLREAGDANPLHILFAGGPRPGRIRDVLAAVRGPVLTVADAAVGGHPGPVLYFTHADGRVRFNASLPAAAARNLKLSAKLLAVALQVEGR